MRCLRIRWLLLLLIAGSLTVQAGTVKVHKGSFEDDSRKRSIPYYLYHPAKPSGTHPVILFSHGLGGSRENAAYLGRHLAQAGYFVYHLQHSGSDQTLWKGKSSREARRAITDSLKNLNNARNRFEDIPFFISELEKRKQDFQLIERHLDLDRLGMAGHSYGGIGTQVAAGMHLPLVAHYYKVPQVRAGFVLSPSLPQHTKRYKQAFAKVDIPLFHLTGSKDASIALAGRNFDPSSRTKPYEYIDGAEQYLLVLDGQGHMLSVQAKMEAEHIRLVQEAALLFFDAHLRNDKQALFSLRDDFARTLDRADHFTWKPAQ